MFKDVLYKQVYTIHLNITIKFVKINVPQTQDLEVPKPSSDFLTITQKICSKTSANRLYRKIRNNLVSGTLHKVINLYDFNRISKSSPSVMLCELLTKNTKQETNLKSPYPPVFTWQLTEYLLICPNACFANKVRIFYRKANYFQTVN